MLQAVGDQVIVKLHHEGKTGLIYIPESVKSFNADYYGEVIAVGEDEKFGLKVGDKVFMPPGEGFKITHNGEDFLALKSRHLWGLKEE